MASTCLKGRENHRRGNYRPTAVHPLVYSFTLTFSTGRRQKAEGSLAGTGHCRGNLLYLGTLITPKCNGSKDGGVIAHDGFLFDTSVVRWRLFISKPNHSQAYKVIYTHENTNR